MYQKRYKVTGEDVDDFMVMQEDAYKMYSVSSLKSFLYETNRTKNISNTFLTTKKVSQEIKYYKDLMFTQQFVINLDIVEIQEGSFNIQNRFFNTNNELCVVTSLRIN